MRNFTKLVIASAMLATQATPTASTAVAASVSVSIPTVVAPQTNIVFSTSSINALEIQSPPAPNFDTDVLIPLRAKQAQEATAAQAQKIAAAKARALEISGLSSVSTVGDHASWMSQAGISPSDFAYVDFIVNHEASWEGVTKWNYAGSGAYGMFQALPGSKMAVYGSDWATNPVTQIKWANAYAISRYGSWYGAYEHWLSFHAW
ncbi:MAG: hypothetical protein ACHQUB_00965 [Candidatus Saccharimonadia bacterium]